MWRDSTGKGAPSPLFQTPGSKSLELQPRNSAPMESLPVNDECYADSGDFPPPRPPKRESKYEDKDTNILMIKFGALSKPCEVHTGDPVMCSNDQCAAILNFHSKITKEAGIEGNVRFCVHACMPSLKIADIACTK
jgi:hypothetical protein